MPDAITDESIHARIARAKGRYRTSRAAAFARLDGSQDEHHTAHMADVDGQAQRSTDETGE